MTIGTTKHLLHAASLSNFQDCNVGKKCYHILKKKKEKKWLLEVRKEKTEKGQTGI